MIPDVPREQILEALARFDRELRDTPAWRGWEENGENGYSKSAISHEGRTYPLKQIISLATNTPTHLFEGGSESKVYLEARGFTIVPLNNTTGKTEEPPTIEPQVKEAEGDQPQKLERHTTGGVDEKLVQQVNERNVWLFQANPRNYHLAKELKAMRPGDRESWSVSRYRDQMQPGDIAILWQAGKERGIYGIGELLGEPYRRDWQPDPDAIKERPYLAMEWRVDFRITHILDRPILAPPLLNDPVLRNMMILRSPTGTNFRVTHEEWQALREILADRSPELSYPATLPTANQIREEADGDRVLRQSWPDGPNGATFVLVHGEDWGKQRYGQSYTFSRKAGGQPRQLIEALEAQQSGGEPVHVIIYRTGPYYSFTAWARVIDIVQRPLAEDDMVRWDLRLDQHEFPVPLNLKGDASYLTRQLPWLSKGLAVAFRGFSIRQIPLDEFQAIIDAAQDAAEGGALMSYADAAFTILSRDGSTPLHASAILEQALTEGLVQPKGQTPQLSLSSALLRDPRFENLGKNMWQLTNLENPSPAPEPPAREGAAAINASADAQFWRIHVPRQYWDAAHKNNVIAVGFVDNPTAQGLKRFKRIKIGDRVVAYVQGGSIGSIGVVTQPYDEDDELAGTSATLFDGKYQRRLRVTWADAPTEPKTILDELKDPDYTDLYNRLKNPHTVIPLRREDYVQILGLLGVGDVGNADRHTRLPEGWSTLTSFYNFIQILAGSSYSAEEIFKQAQQMGDFDTSPDADTLIDSLRQLRLLGTESDDAYRPRPYTAGDRTAALRLMALALLVPAEGSEDIYTLPARSIVRRLRHAEMPQSITSFAPDLGPDGQKLLAWYAEAGLITTAGDTWRWAEGALDPLPGDDQTTAVYNQFLTTLLAELDGRLAGRMQHADGPLPPAPNLEEGLRELGQELLIDTTVVRRIYRSLMAGRHIVLSGPPGTGKTELARRVPELLWKEPAETVSRLSTNLESPPVEVVTEQRHGYKAVIVTATEDWGVRDIVGGIAPRLDGETGGMSYSIQYGKLTHVILQHYAGTDGGRRLPTRPYSRWDYHENGRRYRGAWLIIDEFTRAPVDAAFGSLLTTLGGSDEAWLSVPTGDFGEAPLPLPPDFRIIGTLNSFDRHFLNQMSEALKRRFDFIDVLPPPPAQAQYERGIAAMQALRRLRKNGFTQITMEGSPPAYHWPDMLAAEPLTVDGLQRYELHVDDEPARYALESFWRLFEAIRVFRQLGTAQAQAVYATTFAGVLVGMLWDEALDAALADSLADQLQVMTRDEQQFTLAYAEAAGDPQIFLERLEALQLPVGRLATLLHALREADELRNSSSDIDASGLSSPSVAQLERIISFGEPLALPTSSIFRRRLRSLIGERGL